MNETLNNSSNHFKFDKQYSLSLVQHSSQPSWCDTGTISARVQLVINQRKWQKHFDSISLMPTHSVLRELLINGFQLGPTTQI